MHGPSAVASSIRAECFLEIRLECDANQLRCDSEGTGAIWRIRSHVAGGEYQHSAADSMRRRIVKKVTTHVVSCGTAF